MVVLGPDLKVEIWSDQAQELWGLRSDEVRGQPFSRLDIGLPVEELWEPILQSLTDGPRGNELVARRRQPARQARSVAGSPAPVWSTDKARRARILLMEEVSHDPGELSPD